MTKCFISILKKSTIIIILMSIVLISLLLYISSRLPDYLNVFMFTKGFVGVELLNKDFIMLDEHLIFYKTGNVTPIIEYYQDKDYDLYDEIGSGYIFYKNKNRFNLDAKSVTRWHSVITVQ